MHMFGTGGALLISIYVYIGRDPSGGFGLNL